MKPITAKTFLEYRYVSDPAFSPDGRLVAFISQTADWDANCYRGDLYLSRDGGEPFRLTALGDVHSFCWTPQGTLLFPGRRSHALAAAQKRGEELTAYYEISPDGGEATLAFTLPLKAQGLIAMEGDLCAFIGEYVVDGPQTPEENLAFETKEQMYNTYRELPYLLLNQGTAERRRPRVYIYNRRTGELTAVSDVDKKAKFLSASGTRLVYSAAKVEEGYMAWDLGIYTYDAATGEHRCVMPAEALMTRHQEVYARWWGDKIIVFGSKGETFGRTQSPDAWLIDPATGEMSLFLRLERNVSYRSVMSDSKLGGGVTMRVAGDRIYCTYADGCNCFIRWFDKDGNWSENLTPDGSVDGFDVFEGKLAYCGFFGDALAELYLDGRQVSRMNDALLAGLSVVTPKHMTFENDAGLTLDGFWMEPVGYTPGKKYPAVLHVHGGPRCALGSIFFHEHQMFANAGYFVLYCNPRGSEGRGDAFADVWGKMGSIDYDDIMAFADAALARCPDIDPKRVGIMGGSYGGFMTNWAVGHTDRFAAACSQRSIANWITFEHTGAIGYYWSKIFNHCNTAENQEYLWDISPLKYAHNCKTPTLFIHSDQDNECWIAEGIQMYTAVRMAGAPAKICLFHGEGHELSRSGRPQPRLARWEEMLAWMDTYLK